MENLTPPSDAYNVTYTEDNLLGSYETPTSYVTINYIGSEPRMYVTFHKKVANG